MMAQGLARDLGKQGIHVFYVIIDGIVDLQSTRDRMPQFPVRVFYLYFFVLNLSAIL